MCNIKGERERERERERDENHNGGETRIDGEEHIFEQ